MFSRNSIRSVALVLICLAGPVVAQAQLFGDDDARRAILDLRQRFDQAVIAQNRLVEENTQLRRSMLQLQSDIGSLRDDMAKLRGRDDEIEHELLQLKAQQTQAQNAAQESQDQSQLPEGAAGANPADSNAVAGGAAPSSSGAPSAGDKQAFDAALGKFQGGDFSGAQSAFAAFVKQRPNSSLTPDALFWLGNAQYATRDYRQAITNFRSLIASNPNSARAPEALLSIASCQTELGDKKGARTTLESLVKQYPKSQAAQAGRDRLAK